MKIIATDEWGYCDVVACKHYDRRTRMYRFPRLRGHFCRGCAEKMFQDAITSVARRVLLSNPRLPVESLDALGCAEMEIAFAVSPTKAIRLWGIGKNRYLDEGSGKVTIETSEGARLVTVSEGPMVPAAETAPTVE